MQFTVADGVGTVLLDRPDKLNALTFEVYGQLRDLFRTVHLPSDTRGDVRVIVLRGSGRAFCSGGDVHEIIGATLSMEPRELLAFTRMTGEVIRAMRECPVPIVAAVHGMAAGAGAVLALASDFRVCSPSARFAFLSFQLDTALPGFYGATEDEVAGWLGVFERSFTGLPGTRSFVAPGAGHVVMDPARDAASNAALSTWLTQMVTDDPSWSDVAPPGLRHPGVL